MKSKIGITVNYSNDDKVGEITHLGGANQEWQLIANDYIKAVEKAGGLPILIPIYGNVENIGHIIDILDGIIFSGGNDIDPSYYNESTSEKAGDIVPKRDVQEFTLMELAKKKNIPILGICRGHQLLNISSGGSLYQDLETHDFENHFLIESPMNEVAHGVNVEDNSICKEIFGSSEIKVNSYHHQSVNTLGKNLKVTVVDSKGVIEAIELDTDICDFALGVQWHPETLIEHQHHLNIFKTFISSCKGDA